MWLLLAEQEDAQQKLPAAQLDCLWAKYDCDKDGSLSRMELTRLIQDYSGAIKEHIEKVAEKDLLLIKARSFEIY